MSGPLSLHLHQNLIEFLRTCLCLVESVKSRRTNCCQLMILSLGIRCWLKNWILIECIFPVQIFLILKWKQQNVQNNKNTVSGLGRKCVSQAPRQDPELLNKTWRAPWKYVLGALFTTLKHQKFSVQISFNKI